MTRLWLFAAMLFMTACTGSRQSTQPPIGSELVVDGKLWSSLFQQKAAEYRALCFQAYNIARLRLDQSLEIPGSRPRAIITDIDETLLDNSPYAVHQALIGKDYDDSTWRRWTERAIADTVPGSLGFFQYAASLQVEVFYVTNRREYEREGTLQNLKKFGFPFANDQHLLLRKDVSSKEPRRQQIGASFDIVLLLGDNLADFSSLFDPHQSIDDRSSGAAQLNSEFGKRFIVLPNPNYGGWEESLYHYNFRLTPAQKDSAIRANLKSY